MRANIFFTHKLSGVPQVYTLVIAIFSVVANEIIFRMTLSKAKLLQHQLLEANAWHHRSDAASSLVVVVGIAGSLAGFVYLDTLAALIVGVLIIKMGFELALSSMRELVDTGLDPLTLNAIKNEIIEIPGVRALHQLRTRSMAGNIFLDVHILVNSKLSVSEGHYIATQVETMLLRQFKSIIDVTVHVDPENDETSLPSQHLPSRDGLEKILESRWQTLKGYPAISALNIHYLNGKLIVEVVLPLSALSDPAEAPILEAAYLEAVKGIEWLDEVYLLFR